MKPPATRALQERLTTAFQQANETLGRDLRQETVVVAVSGGPDSLALLSGLRQLMPPHQLVVAHLDHQLRPDSGADASMVADLARQWGHPFAEAAIDVAELADRESMSLETAARTARYAFLAQTAVGHSSSVVVTGHHRGDQAETVLMHIVRGSGVAGLRGMETLATVPGHPEILLWRPLLDLGATTLEAACTEQGLTPAIDPTNADTRFLRNRLRHDLLPLMQAINPQIEARLSTLASIVTADYDLLVSLVDEAWNRILLESGDGWAHFDWQAWLAQPLALRRSTLRRAIEVVQPGTSEWSFQALESQRQTLERATTGARIDLQEGLLLSLQYGIAELVSGRATVLPPRPGAPQLPAPAALSLPVPGRVVLQDDWSITARLVQVDSLESVTGNSDSWLATVKLSEQPFVVRPRLSGERFPPLGLDGHYAKIKAMMIDRKLPASLRPLWPIVATDQEPVWLVGLSIADGWRLTTVPITAVELRCKQGE